MPAIPQGVLTPVVSAAVATGVQPSFSFQPRPNGGNFNVLIGATGTFTPCTATIEVSFDGGATWKTFVAVADFVANPVQTVTTFVAGPLYRYNIATFGGTSVTLTIAAN